MVGGHGDEGKLRLDEAICVSVGRNGKGSGRQAAAGRTDRRPISVLHTSATIVVWLLVILDLVLTAILRWSARSR